MHEAPASAEAIIVALGDTGKVAEELSLLPSIVSGWKDRGIPSSRWIALVDLASKVGRSEITLEILARFGRRRRTPAEAAE